MTLRRRVVHETRYASIKTLLWLALVSALCFLAEVCVALVRMSL